MRLLVVDAQGGGVGKEIIHILRKKYNDLEITCVGTNSIATNNMMKAGASNGATGENAICFNCKRADIIVGPIGIIQTNSLYGEITAKMAEAVSTSLGKRILIPFFHEDNIIVGINDYSIKHLIELAINEIEKLIDEEH